MTSIPMTNPQNYSTPSTCDARTPGTNERCGQEAVPHGMLRAMSFNLCPGHRAEMYAYREAQKQFLMAELVREGSVTQSPGVTYIARLTDGTIKIGRTVNLCTRLQTVSRDYNEGHPVELLRVLEGGRTTELQVHKRWYKFRLTRERGERFLPDPELMNWIESLPRLETPGIQEYELWRERTISRTLADA